jgi:hypothetical protein
MLLQDSWLKKAQLNDLAADTHITIPIHSLPNTKQHQPKPYAERVSGLARSAYYGFLNLSTVNLVTFCELSSHLFRTF